MRTIAVVVAAGCGRVAFDPAIDGSADSVFTVAAHVFNSCAIIDGALSCWGANMRGQLATGDQIDRFAPTPIGVERDWITVMPGQDHICGVRGAGDLYCWGDNSYGQLGVGDFIARADPTRVDLGRPVVAIDTWFHTCALLDNGELWCWGHNDEGQLGQNDSVAAADIPAPVPVSPGMGWSRFSVGQGHTVAVSNSVVYGTGRNSTGELGLGNAAPLQLRVMTSIDTGYATVVGGQNSSCGIRTDASLTCWGGNLFGLLGTGDVTMRALPTTIAADQRDVDIDTFHTCALSPAGTMTCWGRNVEGQLGTGDFNDRLTPAIAGSFDDWIQLSVGRFHTCGMRSDRSVWCVGQNSFGQLGIPGATVSDWRRVL